MRVLFGVTFELVSAFICRSLKHKMRERAHIAAHRSIRCTAE